MVSKMCGSQGLSKSVLGVRGIAAQLFPIPMPDSATLKKWDCLDSDTGEALAETVRKYHLPDFSNWQHPAAIERAFARLEKDLRTSLGVLAVQFRPACLNCMNALTFHRDLRRVIGRVATKSLERRAHFPDGSVAALSIAAGGTRRAGRSSPPAREGHGLQRARQRDRHLQR